MSFDVEGLIILTEGVKGFSLFKWKRKCPKQLHVQVREVHTISDDYEPLLDKKYASKKY